jgi:mono/diheme cytochrome c family protein
MVLAATSPFACKDDGGAPLPDGAAAADAARATVAEGGAAPAPDAARADGAAAADGGTAADASRGDGAAGDGARPQTPQARGEYLVKVVLDCVGCHTPRDAMNRPDLTKLLAGRVCFIDSAPPADNGMGCLHTPNLTNHETGLKNRTDAEIKDMFTRGMRPDGKVLFPTMPYFAYHALAAADADAIVAYLRTVPAVDNMIPGHEGPQWSTRPNTALSGVTADLPAVPMNAPNAASATRGRSLAGAACLGCHSPVQMGMGVLPIKVSQAFEGGREFANQTVGGAMRSVHSTNLTPHQTGLAGWTAMDIVKALKEGRDKAGKGLCPPMPAGPMGLYKDLTDADATDIAHYLLALPAKNNMIPMACEL